MEVLAGLTGTDFHLEGGALFYDTVTCYSIEWQGN